MGVAENHVNGLIELARAVDVPHPVKLRLNAQVFEHAPELGDEMVGHVRRRRTGRRRDVAERRPKILLKVFTLAVGDFVHRIVVVAAKQVAHRHTLVFQRSEDGIVNQRPAQRADVSTPRRRLRVVDGLRAFDFLGQLVTPEHIV